MDIGGVRMMIRPMLFNNEMVRAILEGRKTVTRRIVKPQLKREEGKWDWRAVIGETPIRYRPGDILYVRETYCKNYFDESFPGYRNGGLRGNRNAYKADYRKDIVGDVVPEPKWSPSIHMPKEAARIWLKVTDVGVERLQDITNLEAKKEGVICETDNSGQMHRRKFISLWDSTIKKSDLGLYGWAANPWVWVIKFERCEKPEGEDGKEM